MNAQHTISPAEIAGALARAARVKTPNQIGHAAFLLVQADERRAFSDTNAAVRAYLNAGMLPPGNF